MGNWNISIRGIGSHHNTDNPLDADKMAAGFIEELKAAGHVVTSAEMTHGGTTVFVSQQLDNYGMPIGLVTPETP